MKINLTVLYNFPLHYREPIFLKIDNYFNVNWFFGDKLHDIRMMDIQKLNSARIFKTYHIFGSRFTYTKGVINKKTCFDKNLLVFGDLNSISTLFVLLIRKCLLKKSVVWSHGAYGNEPSFIINIKKIYFSLASLVLTYNERSSALLKQWGCKKETQPIYNSLGSIVNSKIIASKNYKECNLLYLGRITDIKCLNILCDAYYTLKKSYPFINLKIVGDKLPGSKKVKFKTTSAVYNENEIKDLFEWATVTVSPGNIGLLALNSIRHGTPIISHSNWENQMPEFEILEEGVTGFTFEEGNSRSLSNIIESNFILSEFKINKSFFKQYNEKWNTENQLKILKNIFK